MEPLTIRPVSTIVEYDACEEIQRRAWGYRDIDVVPTNELISVERSGGLVLGAFLGARMVGFCFGLVGRDHASGLLYHSSRMVGVDPEFRGRGVAYALKLKQKAAVLAQGLDLIRWTFEPLEAANAILNLRKLGAEATGYVRDLYGTATTSPLHQGLGTDRLLVDWWLKRPRRTAEKGSAIEIEIPRDVQALRSAPREAASWRQRTREAFERAFAAGYVAFDFDPATSRYCLQPRGTAATAPARPATEPT